MKKFLLTLALTGMCVFGLTACKDNESAENLPFSQAEAPVLAEQLMGTLEEYNSAYKTGQIDAAYIEGDPVLGSYITSMEEVGEYISLVDGSVKITGTEENFKLTFDIAGTKRNATIELSFDGTKESLTVSPEYAMSELMSKAGMNTLMGMGTVFAVLILIMILIYFLGWIAPKIEKAANAVSSFFAKRKEKRAAKKAAKKAAHDTGAAVDNTIAQIIKNEELSDDTELVAVIAAAIAAYEGTSADGVVIRSIRRASTNKWQRA